MKLPVAPAFEWADEGASVRFTRTSSGSEPDTVLFSTGVLMVIHSKPEPTVPSYQKTISRIQADCRRHTALVLEWATYDSPEIDGGRIVESGHEPQPLTIVPHLLPEARVTALCGGAV